MLLDACQSLPHMPVDVQELGADPNPNPNPHPNPTPTQVFELLDTTPFDEIEQRDLYDRPPQVSVRVRARARVRARVRVRIWVRASVRARVRVCAT